MDRLKKYIEVAQGKTSQEKHSIALIIASSISGMLFVIWISIALYWMRTQPSKPQQTTQAQEIIEQEQPANILSNEPEQTDAPTYIDIESVPAVYRPDSSGTLLTPPPAEGIITPTSTTQETPVQGSDRANPVIE